MAQQLAVGGVSLGGVRKSLPNERGKCCWNDFCVVCLQFRVEISNMEGVNTLGGSCLFIFEPDC